MASQGKQIILTYAYMNLKTFQLLSKVFRFIVIKGSLSKLSVLYWEEKLFS